jgi:hypothetical protein
MVVLHVLQEGFGRLDNVGVEQNLIDDRLDVGYGEQELQVVDGEAVMSDRSFEHT